MTDKEKAKAYDEALERARKQKYDYQKEFDKTDKNSQLAGILRSGISAIELAFPELAESEDERIRKDIILHFQQIKKDKGATSEIIRRCDERIAYLEKQKEQDECPEYCVRSHCIGCPIYEKQKEQKQAEYLDLDNASQDYVYNHFCQGADFTPDYIKGLMEDSFIDGANWQKEQKPLSTEETELNSIAFLEQMGYTCIPPGAKPSEWSEDDEEMLIRLLDSISIGNDYKEMRNWLLPKLKSLRHKSAKHDLAIRFMKYLDENRPEDKMCLSNGECADIEQAFQDMDWGRIIRYAEKYQPHWKPSEKQMEMLATFVNLRCASRHEANILESLYIDLKKL